MAAACKFPPSIDIVDITGRRLRTIEGEMNGVSIFKQPTFLSSMNEYILITDRQDKSLVCIDQGGEVKFVHKTSKDSSSFPQGICTDEQNRAYLVDGPNVVMVSAEGKQLCQLLTSLPDPRAVTVGKDNLMAVSMDGRGVTFFTLAELKGPYNWSMARHFLCLLLNAESLCVWTSLSRTKEAGVSWFYLGCVCCHHAQEDTFRPSQLTVKNFHVHHYQLLFSLDACNLIRSIPLKWSAYCSKQHILSTLCS